MNRAFLACLCATLSACPEGGDPPPVTDGPRFERWPDILRPDIWTTEAAPPAEGGTPDGPLDAKVQPDVPKAPLFGDVPATDPHFDAIQWVGDRGYMTGCDSGSPPSFCPTEATERADMAAAVARMKFGESFSYSPSPHFSDVPATHPSFKYIQKLYDVGATAGCATGQFCPDTAATRAQGATLIIRTKLGASFTYSTLPHFSDVPATHPSFKYIQKLHDEGIAVGCGSAKFCPDEDLLRQHLAVFLYNAQTL